MTNRRFDRAEQAPYRLAAPRRLPTGGIVYEMAAMMPGVQRYPWGAEYVTPEALSDADFLKSIKGIPIIDDDATTHSDGTDTHRMDRDSIGRALDARWDAEQQVVIVEAVIDVERGLAKVRNGVTGVSAAYSADIENVSGETPDGTRYDAKQVRRYAPHNIVITTRPRAGDRARLRADTREDDMKPEDIQKAITDGLAPVVTRLAALEDAETKRADAATEAAEAAKNKAPIKMGTFLAISDAAAKVGVELRADSTLLDAGREVAAKVVGDKAADLDEQGIALVLATANTIQPKRADAWTTITDGTKQNRADSADDADDLDFTFSN